MTRRFRTAVRLAQAAVATATIAVLAGLAPVAQAGPAEPPPPASPVRPDAQAAGPTASGTPSFRWTTGDPVITPMPDQEHDSVAVKDPSVVWSGGKYHVFMTTTPGEGKGWHMAYKSFTDWSEADDAPIHYLDETAIGPGYRAAPQVFWFEPQQLWYLIYQDGNAAYSTTKDISDPTSWSAPKHFYSGMPQVIQDNIGNGYWLDFWNICDRGKCYLFSSDDNGHLYRSETSVADFPNGYDESTVIAREEADRFDFFEAGALYKVRGTGKYLLLMEAIGDDGARMYRSWTADAPDADGDEWVPLADTAENPFARSNNVTYQNEQWSVDVSHGELLRTSRGMTPTIDPCEPLQMIFQGYDPDDVVEGGGYGDLPYRLGLLTADGPNPISALCEGR